MSHCFVDRLESRLCFAAGPLVISELFVGTAEDATALVIKFNSPLDSAKAQNPDNFLFGGSRGNGRTTHKVPFETPVYNPTDQTVTLTFTKPLALTRFKRVKVIVYSLSAGGVADPSGNLVDGDRDGNAGTNSDLRYKIGRGTSLSYHDIDGDRVKLRVHGASGRPMTTLIGPDKTVKQVWVTGNNNSLFGSVKLHKFSDGLVRIGRVVLEETTSTNDLLSPPFNVGQTVTDPSAGVDPSIVTF